jgi:hypothetical protein
MLGALAEIYKDAFARDPWCEDWSISDAKNQLEPYIDKGMFSVVSINSKPIAFAYGCSAPDSRINSDLERPLEGLKVTSFYFADICVATGFANKGYASRLIASLLHQAFDQGFKELIVVRPRGKVEGEPNMITLGGKTNSVVVWRRELSEIIQKLQR